MEESKMKFTFIILGSGVNNKIAMGIVYKYVKFNQTYKIKKKKKKESARYFKRNPKPPKILLNEQQSERVGAIEI